MKARLPLSPFFLATVTALATSVVACGGIPKLDPKDVSKVMVDSHGGKFCPWGEVKLDVAVVLTDGKLRATNGKDDSVRIDARKNFKYAASAGKIDVRVDGVYFVPPQDYAFLLENDVVATATLLERPDLAPTTVTFVPDFGCSESVYLGGYAGRSGETGGAGGDGTDREMYGGNGGSGGDGEQGGDAGALEVTLGMVDTPKRGRLVIARSVARATGETDLRLFAPGPGRLKVDNSGGAGGRGGDGGRGGAGGGWTDGIRSCDAGDGGDGGDGGSGAGGGNGGPVTVFVDEQHPELEKVIAVTNHGGAGGEAGSGGQGGDAGWAEVKSANGAYFVCKRDGRPGRGGHGGRFRGTAGAAGPRAVFTTTSSPFPQGVASVGVRATSTNTNLDAPVARVKPPGGVTTSQPPPGSSSPSGTFGKPKADAPTAAALFAQLKGTAVLRIENKGSLAICELYPLDPKTRKPVTQNVLLAPLPAGQARDVARWGLPAGAVPSTLVQFGVRSCDGKEGVAQVTPKESITIVVSGTVSATAKPAPHTAPVVLTKP